MANNASSLSTALNGEAWASAARAVVATLGDLADSDGANAGLRAAIAGLLATAAALLAKTDVHIVSSDQMNETKL
jgi:hypothetical protein